MDLEIDRELILINLSLIFYLCFPVFVWTTHCSTPESKRIFDICNVIFNKEKTSSISNLPLIRDSNRGVDATAEADISERIDDLTQDIMISLIR